MRVIAGSAKGTKLYHPSNASIRPTLDRVRTSLFDIIGKDIKGKLFLDLFAGTGANGIEALSRGAERVWFVDNSPQSIELIKKNLEKTHLLARAIIIKARLPEGIEDLPTGMDYIFADPPYDFNLWEKLITRLVDSDILKAHAFLILEHSKQNVPPDVIDRVSLTRREKYGDTILSFYTII
ncbi:MAG: 16S rRNA (guanine(966)-N(2))-methyltransferase RsmD [Candidatus Hydrogenedentes bacterium]|nr:16S rRNA (guanine(966)-N(2))-methyltransferase RsmD [Candidatus Hydrogenedentota bacterium]